MNFQNRKLIPSKYIYLFMAFVCFLLLFLSVVFGERISVLKSVASAVVTPMQSGINQLGTKLYDNMIEKKNIDELLADNKKLKKQLEETEAKLQRYEKDSSELKRIQELVGLQEQYPDYDMVGARVIATDSTNWFYTFIIDKGEDDGVFVGCNVLAGNGLAGIVTEVGKNYAKVRSIIDENSHISASVSGTKILCTVSGDLTLIEDGYISVGYINKEDQIDEGAKLVTSHVSDKFLPGLLIGYISDVSVDSNNLTQSAKCMPVVEFRNLQEVMVILTKKEDISGSSANKILYDNISSTEETETNDTTKDTETNDTTNARESDTGKSTTEENEKDTKEATTQSTSEVLPEENS